MPLRIHEDDKTAFSAPRKVRSRQTWAKTPLTIPNPGFTSGSGRGRRVFVGQGACSSRFSAAWALVRIKDGGR